MRRRRESGLDLLAKAPWWVSVLLGVIVFVGLRWVLPGVVGDGPIAKALAKAVLQMAGWFALPFALTAVVSAILGARRRKLVDQQTSLESLRSVSWKEFEFLVAEAFRRQGYGVDFSLGAGADGGVDLVLRRDGQKSLVQCKQWRTFSVGVPVVREQFGILAAEHADESIIVTSGSFTAEAVAFAQGKPIRLVDGPQLLELVKSVQAHPRAQETAETNALESDGIESPALSRWAAAPKCPECGREMVLRTARRGANAGQQFWGCPGYPKCRGTRPV